MSTTSSDPSGPDPRRVRLSWPGEPVTEEQDRSAAAPEHGTRPPAAGADQATRPPIADPARRPPVVDPATRPPAAPDDDLAYEADLGSVVRPSAVIDVDPMGGQVRRRAVVEAYDRFADRVLQRLRADHEDIDGGLAELRSEMATLRQAVDDLGDRVQLRQLRSWIDELRSDVTGLRRAVLEWPELERVGADITALRADMADVVARSHEKPPPVSSLAPLLEEVAALRDDVAVLTPVLEEITALREEVAQSGSVVDELVELRSELASLRRRITLRAPDAG